ncbi:rubredoxin, partial [Segetibacter sp.]|uniref:rubredoxin n=1 Tax=Segetibacter sp. TaxID=2231182 RepID=UPI00261C95AF
IRYFDKEDVRTYGLSFAVKTRLFSSMLGSVVVRKQEVRNPGRLKALERFEILYTADFNPNTSNLISFRKDVEKDHLGTYLVSLCKYFYELESREKTIAFENLHQPAITPSENVSSKIVYQCKHCFSIYDETIGGEETNTPSETFPQLPADYHCPLCEAGKEDFEPINLSMLNTSIP